MGANTSLVLFTSFAQAAVGMVLLFFLLPAAPPAPAANDGNSVFAERLRSRGGVALAAALVIFGLGVLFSMLHLSDPLISFYSITNLGTSWLSREILFVGLFGFSTLLFFFVRSTMVNLLAAAAGIGLLVVMSRVYTSPPVPFWSTDCTFWIFLSTGIMLGAATLLLVAAVRNNGQGAVTRSLAAGPLPIVLAAAAGARLIFGLLQLYNGIGSPVRLDLALANLTGIVLALVVLFLAVQRGWRATEKDGARFIVPVASATALLWVAELAGRVMFYEALSPFTL